MRERYQIMNMYGFSATHHNKQPASSPSPTGSEQDKMKPRELLSLVLVLLGLVSGAVLQATVCPDIGFVRRPGTELCYLHVETALDFFEADRTCVRDGGSLVLIESAEEDSFVFSQFYTSGGQREFWIGLYDLDREGDFRWVDGTVPSFLNWAGNAPTENDLSFDCVKYAADGWRVHTDFCATSELPFVCRVPTCESVDGVSCFVMTAATTAPPASGGISIILVVAVVVVVIIVVLAVVLVLCLVWAWKYHNDAFQRYCCCCVAGKSKTAVHSLQQENQRLRHELSQHKVSLSGRYSKGQFAKELSGVPDGHGGVLPTIKQPLRGSAISPTIPEGRPLTLSPTQPPPLSLQRGTSRVTPLSRNAPFNQPPTPRVFTQGARTPLTVTSPFPSIRPVRQLSQTRPPETRPLPATQREPGKEEGPKKEVGAEKEAEAGEKEAPPTEEEARPAEKPELEREDSSSSGSGSSSSEHSEQEQAS